MSDPTTTATAAPSPAPGVTLNSAVQSCVAAFNQTLAAEHAAGHTTSAARDKAVEAFCKAMPYLTSHGNIRGYIACVGQGMLLKIIRCEEGSKLLYAAQIAMGALPRELRAVGRPGDPCKTQ